MPVSCKKSILKFPEIYCWYLFSFSFKKIGRKRADVLCNKQSETKVDKLDKLVGDNISG